MENDFRVWGASSRLPQGAGPLGNAGHRPALTGHAQGGGVPDRPLPQGLPERTPPTPEPGVTRLLSLGVVPM